MRSRTATSNLLVELEPGRALLDLTAFEQDLDTLLGRAVELRVHSRQSRRGTHASRATCYLEAGGVPADDEPVGIRAGIRCAHARVSVTNFVSAASRSGEPASPVAKNALLRSSFSFISGPIA